jgi:neutral amino acid transport system ATP-binding protein
VDDGEHAEPAVLLRVKGLERSFGGIRAVAGATFDVPAHSITALIGPNGAGKTTAFNLVTGFLRPDRGEVSFEGRSIFRHSTHSLARAGLLRTFQVAKALAGMTVLDNMMLGARGQPGEQLLGLLRYPLHWKAIERANRERAIGILERFRLAQHARAYAGTLSGGQRKLLELARLLMAEPVLALLDEPLAGVNPVLQGEILSHMHDLRREQGLTFLFIEHDIDAVMDNADGVVVMAQGKVIASGTPTEVRENQDVIDAYIGTHGPT